VQVGDLVELSACGKKLKSFKGLHGHHGIVIKPSSRYGLYQIHWFGKPVNFMKRKDIKHVKNT